MWLYIVLEPENVEKIANRVCRELTLIRSTKGTKIEKMCKETTFLVQGRRRCRKMIKQDNVERLPLYLDRITLVPNPDKTNWLNRLFSEPQTCFAYRGYKLPMPWYSWQTKQTTDRLLNPHMFVHTLCHLVGPRCDAKRNLSNFKIKRSILKISSPPDSKRC